jgi:PPIC-type PPIASE domain
VRLLREPLVHFLVTGAVLFAAFGLSSRRAAETPDRIVVTRGQVEQIVAGFTRFHRRPPSAAEMEGLVRDHVREEVAVREALALGLDRDDAVIRRRLREKLEFVFDDVSALGEPTDDELRGFLQAHAETFRTEPTLTFRQVFLDPSRRGSRLGEDAATLVTALERDGAPPDLSNLGDPFLLERDFVAMPAGEVAKLFGEGFAAELVGLAAGRWHGPIASGYGAHLVLVRERTEGRLPPLDEVHDAVRREWSAARKREIGDRLYAGMLERYSVTVESFAPLEPDDGGDAVAVASPP